jgi:hypothetical protein
VLCYAVLAAVVCLQLYVPWNFHQPNMPGPQVSGQGCWEVRNLLFSCLHSRE